MGRAVAIRTYKQPDSIVFLKTKEIFGGLSNMASGYPLFINGIRILSSEALYQACRFPHLPEAQRKIISQTSPMTAKMVSKPYREQSRPDWERVRVKIMRWCLRVKLAQNRRAFGALLLETGDLPIVEKSFKDEYWGAKPTYADMLVGMNVLGRLLMELREELKSEQFDNMAFVEPPAIPDFLLDGQPIGQIAINTSGQMSTTSYSLPSTTLSLGGVGESVQPSLFSNMPLNLPAAETPAVPSAAGVTSTLQPYPTYQDSGIEWLGKIPTHWQVRRMKLLLREVDARSTTGKEQLLRVSQYTGVTQRFSKNGDEPDSRAVSLVGYKRVEISDLVINIMLAWNGSLGVSKYTGIASPAYCVYRFQQNINPWFYHHLLRLPLYKGRIKTASTGVVESRLRLYSDDLGRIEALLPPLEEQNAIVRFLDHANHKIARYIHAKKKLIKLLNEQKQVIIHKAVTRGLDPNVPLKPSGIEWLGDIPAHWEALQLRRVVSFITSGSRGWAAYYSDNGEIFLQSGNLGRSMELKLSFVQHVQLPVDSEGRRTKVQKNDVLICITGALTGNVALVDIDLGKTAYVNQHVALVRPKQKMIVSRFLTLMLHSTIGQTQFKTSESGGTKQGLGLDDVKSVFVIVPPIEEQQNICIELERQLVSFSTTIKQTEREIGLMEEYRTRLVTDVVTGQVDVREAARHLPELDATTESINVLDDVDDLTDDEPEADNGDSGNDD